MKPIIRLVISLAEPLGDIRSNTLCSDWLPTSEQDGPNLPAWDNACLDQAKEKHCMELD